MQNLKNKKIFTLLIAVALILALSISCKSNEDPKDPVEIPSQYYGTWVYTSTGKDALKLQGSTDSLYIAFYDTNGLYLGMILAMIVAGCAEYGARTNMKKFA